MCYLFLGNITEDEEILYFENFDLHTVVTPVDVEKYKELLELTGYDQQKSEYLIDGFRMVFQSVMLGT